MNRLLLGQEDRVIPWAAKIIGFEPEDQDMRAIAWGNDEHIRGAVLYERFSRFDCIMHVASDGDSNWFSRPMLFAIFAYPFVQCGLRRVTGTIASKNAASLRFAQHLGFEVEGLCREAAENDDLVVLGMLRRNCRYIPAEFRV